MMALGRNCTLRFNRVAKDLLGLSSLRTATASPLRCRPLPFQEGSSRPFLTSPSILRTTSYTSPPRPQPQTQPIPQSTAPPRVHNPPPPPPLSNPKTLPSSSVPLERVIADSLSSSGGNGRGRGNGGRGGKGARRLRMLGILVGVGAVVYIVDKYFYADALVRTLRVGATGLVIIADYKLNFKNDPDHPELIDQLHARVADRLRWVCVTNGGLFIKLGQSIGIQGAVLPKPYREAFANIFDAAPEIEWEDVVKVFTREFGKHPEEAFEIFEKKAIASASIAQVHRAKLKEEEGGAWVAVKIQKPEIEKQIDWDLWSYKVLLYSFEKVFDLPFYFIADYVAEQIRRETIFSEEARNAEKTAKFLEGEAKLKGRILVPKVYWNWTSKRVMTADFVQGCRITDKERIEAWHLSVKEVAQAATEVFAAMMFKWGWVHCDPHPGNVLVRPNPNNPRKPQVILLDHGLYIQLPEKFRLEYCQLWKALFILDLPTIEKLAKGWGIGNTDMFASATLLRPTKVSKNKDGPQTRADSDKPTQAASQSTYESQLSLKQKLKTMLENEKLIPKELIFITRCQRMVQANNQMLGSPCNRINILAHWALEGLNVDPTKTNQVVARLGSRQWLREKLQQWLFRMVLLVIDVGFWLSKIRQAWVRLVYGKTEGFEDLLEKQVKDMAMQEFGIEIDSTAFEG